MRPKIHPQYHEITVRRTDGSEFKTSTTWGKAGDTMILDVDILTHNAWVGGKTKVNDKAGQVAKFNQRFAGISFGNKNAAESANETTAAPAAAKAEAAAPKAPAKKAAKK